MRAADAALKGDQKPSTCGVMDATHPLIGAVVDGFVPVASRLGLVALQVSVLMSGLPRRLRITGNSCEDGLDDLALEHAATLDHAHNDGLV